MLTFSSNDILKFFVREFDFFFFAQAINQKSKLHAVNSIAKTRIEISNEYSNIFFVQNVQRDEFNHKIVERKILSMKTHQNNEKIVDCLNESLCM